MIPLMLSILLVCQQGSYTYSSENAIFRETEVFVLKNGSVSSPTAKTPLPARVEPGKAARSATRAPSAKVPVDPFKVIARELESRRPVDPGASVKPDSAVSFSKPEIKEKTLSWPPFVEKELVEKETVEKGTVKEETVKKEAVEREAVVYFDLGSYVLRDSEKEKLKMLPRGKRYEITGYTCDLGSKRINDELARNRALEVKKYLGSPSDAVGKGKCCYVDLKERWKNRRVEIRLLE